MARTQVTFGTCNLYNLNQPGLPMYRDRDGWSQDEYQSKIDWTGRALRERPADVWGYQELWHTDSLKAVLEASGLNRTHKLLSPPRHAGTHIACAGVVRKDILVGEPEWIVDFPADFILDSKGDDPQAPDISVHLEKFSRPVLHFQIKPRANGKRIHVYVCHFKSKGPTRITAEGWYTKAKYSKHSQTIGAALSTIRRTAEATALRMLLTEQMKGTSVPVVVLGDLNDSQHSNTLNILTGQPNYLLSGLSQGGSDTALYSVATLQELRSERDVYYTHVHQNTKESLDHILVSQEFYDNSKQRLWAFDGMEIRNDHLDDEDHKAQGTTDHGIVRARFSYRPA